MRPAALFSVLVFVALAGNAAALQKSHPGEVSAPMGVHYDSGRTQGDTIEEPWVINALPFTVFDNTCGFNDDYDEICPCGESISGDVVYAYAPPSDQTIAIDLCCSLYDTKVFVYEDGWTPGDPYACNDDFYFDSPCYVYSSRIDELNIFAGHIYYIVVDGYGGSCGDFELGVFPEYSCQLAWPPEALLEGEPPCQGGYQDEYNGGCSPGGSGWTLIEAYDGDCATLCGESCTYPCQSLSFRDSDWFEMTCMGGTVTATCTAEFVVRFALIYGLDCNNLEYEAIQGGLCESVTLTYEAAPGQGLWLSVDAAASYRVPPNDYVLEICGIEGWTTPTARSTWGSIKGLFK